MYESITFESILQRMLDRVPEGIDKREGSIIYDALAPAAVEMQLMYIELDAVLKESFADTASREYLIKRAAERGIKPTASTNAVRKGTFDVNIPIGTRFFINDVTYAVTEKISDLNFKLRCETAGVIGNVYSGQIIPVDYIDGLTTATISDILILGEDEESTEDLRKRYFDTFESEAFGGNVADYKTKINGIQGVGGVKVYPVWNGGGTVKVTIIGSDYKKPAHVFVTAVQTVVDPTQNAGKGYGTAPVGHIVTIDSVNERIVNISMTITYQSGWTWAAIKSNVEATIDAYFLDLCRGWADTQTVMNDNGLVVRISQIESKILSLAGVVDVTGTILNGASSNIILGVAEIPIRGTVNG